MKNTSLLNYNSLSALKLLLTEKHFTKASRQLNISQPALSMLVDKYRVLFNDPLLSRVNNHYLLTHTGENVLKKLTLLTSELELLAQTNKPFNPVNTATQFKVGMCDHGTQLFQPIIQQKVLNFGKHLSLEVHRILAENAFDELSQQKIHLAIGSYQSPPQSLRSQKLIDCEAVCVFSKKSSFNQKKLDLATFITADKIFYSYGLNGSMSTLQKKFQQKGIEISSKINSPFMMANLLTVLQSDTMMITTNHYFDMLKHIFPIAKAKIPILDASTFSIHQYWHELLDKNPAHQWFRNRLKLAVTDTTEAAIDSASLEHFA